MPYVPFPRPGTNGWDSRLAWTQVRGVKSATTGRWTYTTTSGLNDKRSMDAVKITSQGTKIITKFGHWSPVRSYTRTATLVSLTGGPEYLGNQIRADDCTITVLKSGIPVINPSTFMSLVSNTAASTGGLVSGGLPVLDTNTRNRLITECMVKIGGRKANYGESLAEGRKTLSHLAKTVTALVRAILALRRGNFRQFARALRVDTRRFWSTKPLAERWLEYQYAWMPLMADAYATSEVLKKGITRQYSQIKSTRQLTSSSPYVFNTPWAEMRGSVVVSHRCKLWYQLSNQTIDSLQTLGLINPLEVAWAVVPFSFVVDWFLPVGSFLEAFSSVMGLTFIDGAIMSRAEIQAQGEHTSVPSSTPYHLGSRFSWKSEHFGFQRTKVVSPRPSIFVKSPFSTSHVASAAALVRTLRR